VSLVEHLASTLQAVAAHEPEEVTKQEAVRRLLPSIRAAREKGYTLARIAALLSEAGLPVTGQALTSYIKQAAGSPARKKRRRRTALEPAPKESTPPPNGGPVFASKREHAAIAEATEAELGWDREDTPNEPVVAARGGPGKRRGSSRG
jgi:hypothetical protein